MAKRRLDSFQTRSQLTVGDKSYDFFNLGKLEGDLSHLPFSIKVLLENLLRQEDGVQVTRDDVEALLNWSPNSTVQQEISYMPARVLLQDFTGVPAVVDLAAMRDAMVTLGGEASRINPGQPVDLVIDHSVQVDHFGTESAFRANTDIEYQRNGERYQLLRWAQSAFEGFRAVPPGTGIVHQVNLEYLASVVLTREEDGKTLAIPDTLVGTDSHTTMINGLGVLGWGVGGIEAEAAMLDQPSTMLIPEVIGFKLEGALPAGTTATDLVLFVVEKLRKKGVVGKFVEFYGPGLESLTLADRATIANMAPEYGATMGFFPVDKETLAYMRFTGRSEESLQLVEAYLRAQGLLRTEETPDPTYTDSLTLRLETVVPSLAGPKRPQDRVALSAAKSTWRSTLITLLGDKARALPQSDLAHWVDAAKVVEEGKLEPGVSRLDPIHKQVPVALEETHFELKHGSVVIAAITSCTNTSNPSVLMAAGLLAKKAVEKGLMTKPWVKTSLAPGSQVVTDYLKAAGLDTHLNQLRFNLVGYGCTTCIGNSGPLAEPIQKAIQDGNLVVTSVLSGNRNFEGRISPHVKANYLASPPLVVAYALAGTLDIDLNHEPLGLGTDGKPVFLKDIWPTTEEVKTLIRECLAADMYTQRYANVFEGDAAWQGIQVPEGDRFDWAADSTYIKRPPFFEGMGAKPEPISSITGARVLALLGDSVTTDHISPAGSIAPDSPAGRYLKRHGVAVADFNSYGSRRGNHEVMMRGTFANVRLRNQLAPGTEGGWTRHQPSNREMAIYEAALQYQVDGVPLVVLAGKEYGTGSSRDWAAKGPALLGVRMVIAESYERIHRSNLVGMGILPLQYRAGENASSLGLTGSESFDLLGLNDDLKAGQSIQVKVRREDGSSWTVAFLCRIDTPVEVEYYRHGGILQYALRQLLAETGV